MMSLFYLNRRLWLDGQIPSEKFQVRFNPLAPSGKSWQWKMALSWKAPILLFPTRNIKLCWTLLMRDIWVWTSVSLQPKILLVMNSELCSKYSCSKCKQKSSQSMGQEIPVHPWTTPTTDIFHCESSSYLLIVDYTSRFPVVHKLYSMTGLHIPKQCKQVFSAYGWPETLISDNGPCYTSQALTSVMQSYSVNYITSSQDYPQSNGLAEKYVQIVKSLFCKAKEEGKDVYKCLMIYQNIPLTSMFAVTDVDPPRQKC